jgi:hypothetical protein
MFQIDLSTGETEDDGVDDSSLFVPVAVEEELVVMGVGVREKRAVV